MRNVLALLAASVVLANTASAIADVGPPPTCPAGMYRVYHYGHRCVKDGYHLEEGPDGNLVEVKLGQSLDGPKPVEKKDDPPPAPTEFATPPAPPTATADADPSETPANPAPTPPPQRGCACSVAGMTDRDIGFGLSVAAAAFAMTRRLRGKRSRN